MHRIALGFLIVGVLNSPKAASQRTFPASQDSMRLPVTMRVLPQKFYSQHLGFFCKAEVRLQKVSFPGLYIRLGTKEFVDEREGKSMPTRYRKY